MGGEPLLHPDVLKFCYITRKAFPNAEIQLVTNGILFSQQNESFFKELNTNNIKVYLSDYHLSNIKNLDKIKNKVFGDRTKMLKMGIDLHQKDGDKLSHFIDCKNTLGSSCVNLRDGYLYHCPTVAYFDFLLKYFNIELKDFVLEKNGINIFTSTKEDIENYLNNPILFCQYCDIKKRLTAEFPFSLSKKEISEWLF